MASKRSTDPQRQSTSHISIPFSFLVDTVPQIKSAEQIQLILTCWRLEATDFADGNIPVESLLRDQWLSLAISSNLEEERAARILDVIDEAVSAGLLERPGRTETNSTIVRIPLPLRHASMGTGDDFHHNPTGMHADDSAFRLYEENIGELTPLIADQIKVAVETYPPAWIADAILEAVTYNRRSWRYIQRILQNWSRDGRSAGAGGGHEKDRRRHEGTLDPNKYRGGNHLRRAKDP